jgi:hypothetical protein
MSIEQDSHDIMHAVGECLMEWSMVELNICILYSECVSPRKGKFHNPGPHAFIFDSVISIDARMDMIKAIIQWRETTNGHALLVPDCTKSWTRLREKIKTHYKKRHEVAHSSIIQYMNKGGEHIVALAPFATMSSVSSTSKRLTLKELQERKRLFKVLSMEISSFRTRICPR